MARLLSRTRISRLQRACLSGFAGSWQATLLVGDKSGPNKPWKSVADDLSGNTLTDNRDEDTLVGGSPS
jgi:hypothetical protein